MRFHSKPVEENGEVPLADEGRLEEIAERWVPPQAASEPGEGSSCYVVSVGLWRSEAHKSAQLSEILGLVEANGGKIVGHESLQVRKAHPKTFLGTGTCQSLAERAKSCGATMIVIDAQLSPSQTRNLEDATGLAISDREIVILGVFRKSARTRAAQIQVEIAHLQYLRPRIRGLGLDMDQQAGGIMAGRGAGETASELLARQLDDRLVLLKRMAVKIERSSELNRKQRASCDRIALVGYTNAGKTSLMNALTGSDLSARSRPFETLDTTTRSLTRLGGDVVLSDTVGFIRDLPERLLSSFATTLAEAKDATLLVIVVDLSDPEWQMHLQTTAAQLEKLDANQIPRFYVFNKVDLLDGAVPEDLIASAVGGAPHRAISSRDERAIDELREALVQHARGEQHARATVRVPYAAASLSAEIYRSTAVLSTEATDEGLEMTIEGPAHAVARIVRMSEEA